MPHQVELDDELYERLEVHLEDDQNVPELVEELLNMYEAEGAFLQEGYTE